MTIWLTRPNDDSQHMSDLLFQHGIRSIIAPVMDIEPAVSFAWPPAKPDAILLTSRYGARSLATAPRDWRVLPVYCAGPATGQAVSKMGFENIVAVETGVMGVLPLLRDRHAGQTVLYPSGEDIKLDVGALLASANISVERIVTYVARAKIELPAPLLNGFARGELQGIIFASPRAVQLAHSLLKHHQLSDKAAGLDLFCLSVDIAAEAARLIGGRQVHACPIPSYEAMMELLLKHAIKAP